ncbi:TPA: hypothetical protein NJ565_000241 [Vibrio parahaemolyticus]|nr:hypothetical protein [Vibrio parahaemolyticus]
MGSRKIKNEEKHVFILSGVEDYLTESAKKYKRNLMYCTFLILTLSLLEQLDYVSGFKSLLGITVSKEVPIDLVIGIISIVCAYELTMLASYFDVCESHWFGREFLGKKNEGNEAKVVYFEKELRNVSYDFESLETILSSDFNVQEAFNDVLDEKYVGGWEHLLVKSFNDYVSEQGDSLISQLQQQKSKAKDNIDDELLRSTYEVEVSKFIKSLQSPIDQKINQRLVSLERLKDEITSFNSSWKKRVDEKIQRNIVSNTNLSRIIESVSRPHKTIVFFEIYFPLLVGSFSIGIGARHVYCLFLT